MPDADLLRAAQQGTLHQPAVLATQVKRMLRDPKSAAFIENFAGQWLQFRNIDVAKPDSNKFAIFDDALRLSMRRETELFLGAIFREDRSLLEVLNADYTFLNERLARYYGVPGVSGPEFRRVSDLARGGGVLSHGSILTVSSYSTRTSPVLRGKWILENLLNAPPPAPPASVPALDDTQAGLTATLRQQMEQHRQNPACASCHTKMDALGFGLENFDAIGGWRTHDGALPIDTAGELPGGRKFTTPAELKSLLLEEKDAFAKGLSERMLTYALGRGLERYDRPTVSAITAKVKAGGYRSHELILGVVNSLPFQYTRQNTGTNPKARGPGRTDPARRLPERTQNPAPVDHPAAR